MNPDPNPEGWLEEFYPREAQEVQESEAVAHSLRKWRGLRPTALAKYGLDCAPIPIDGDSCALCVHYLGREEDECKSCPLYLTIGKPCDKGDGAPWHGWSYLENPEPMIGALEKTLARETKEALWALTNPLRIAAHLGVQMKYTNQTAFDAVLDHSRKQPFKAVSEDGFRCLYRASRGRSCFIGALMPDEVYDGLSQVERRVGSVSLMREVKAFAELFEADVNVRLLESLQAVHDVDEPHNWEWKLDRVAKRYNLTFTPLEAA